LDAFVRDCLEINTTHWTVVRHANEKPEDEDEGGVKGSRVVHAQKVAASTSDGNIDHLPSPRSLDKMRLTLDTAKQKANQIPTTLDPHYLQKPALRFSEKVRLL